MNSVRPTRDSTDYYEASADSYDFLHGGADHEHVRALQEGWPLIHGEVTTVLDVGCGTGRSLEWVSRRAPGAKLFGVEPSAHMREYAAARVPHADLRAGSGEHLPFADRSMDVVLATGIMHHVDRPARVIDEMFRVAKRAVLISDHNNYAFGGQMARRLRIGLRAAGLLGIATFVKQGFSRRGYSEDDGWWYPYSLFDDYARIASHAERVILFPTRAANATGNLLLSQSHVAILASVA
ncbi:MAG TPA: class I SAM-dependent methyltransferase [Polyangiaceae bacterium]|nr:class I SAM-dependent methyltransferase [Polyangiaceae bacterium]